jgi:hypothetical protein
MIDDQAPEFSGAFCLCLAIKVTRTTREMIITICEQDFLQLDYCWADLGNPLSLA